MANLLVNPTSRRFESFEEYLAYEDGTGKLYELFNGGLVEVPPESGENVRIANRLFFQLALLLGTDRVYGQGLELEVPGEPRNRYPDLTVIRPEHIALLKARNTIRLTMPPPLLVVEVVSPGSLQRERDYVAKRRQYEEIGIPEYWLVDAPAGEIAVLLLQGDRYGDPLVLDEAGLLRSPQFPALALSAAWVLRGEGEPSPPAP